MNMIECLGLDFLTGDEETFGNFLHVVCAEGKPIHGYYGYPYLNREFGWAQFIARTEPMEENKLALAGLDTHLSGVVLWDTVLSCMDLQPKDADPLSRRVLVHSADGEGMAVVNLVNADVLPSFLEDDRVKMQVVAFPLEIDYYPDEDAYADSQPGDDSGRKFLLAEGAILATGLLTNHAPDNPDHDKDHDSDSYMLIRGTVKKVRPGIVKFGEELIPAFVTVIIDTTFGELEIAHGVEQVDQSQREYIKEGATVSGVFILSGDVAIHEHGDGIVRDEEHNLALLRYTLQKGDPKRMQAVLRENSVYTSEASGKEFTGPKEIIDRLQFVRNSNPGKKYFAHLATVTAVKESESPLEYGVGKRCVILAEEEQDNYVSIVFVDTDGEGYITKLTVSTNECYQFRLDESFKPHTVLDDVRLPESVAESILARARFHLFLDHDTTDEAVLARRENVKTYEDNARQLLEAFDSMPELEADERYANLFGYLFAKAIEADWTWRNGDLTRCRLLVSFSSGDALAGRLRTNLEPAVEKQVRFAHDRGKQFYKDHQFFCSSHPDRDPREELMKAMVIVQQIGEVYSQTLLSHFAQE